MTTEAKVPEATMKPLDGIVEVMARARYEKWWAWGSNAVQSPSWDTLLPTWRKIHCDEMRAALLAAQDAGAVLVPEKATELMEDTAFVAMGNVSFNKHEQAGIIHRYLVAASPYRIEREGQGDER